MCITLFVCLMSESNRRKKRKYYTFVCLEIKQSLSKGYSAVNVINPSLIKISLLSFEYKKIFYKGHFPK